VQKQIRPQDFNDFTAQLIKSFNALPVRKLLPAVFLYLLLFFPNPNDFLDLFEAEKNSGTISLSVKQALFLTLFFYLPALIMFLWQDIRTFQFKVFTVYRLIISQAARLSPPPLCSPCKAALLRAACAARSAFFFILDVFFTLSGLFVIGISVVSLSISLDAPVPSQQFLIADYKLSTIITVSAMLCAGALLEEVFFRRYLLAACEDAGLGIMAASLFSLLLFTVPHAWEGLFGMINALLAGLYLTSVYLQQRSLLAPAIAHCLYNTAAFIRAL
jgi:membrane protease YdiL (CAAX protease family)